MESEKKLRKFWKGKKVFVTGHTGFKGTWLLIFLNLFGAKIYGYSLREKKNSFYKIIKKKINLRKNIYSDICDYNKLDRAIKSSKPEIIFHFAAQSLVGESFKKPFETFNTNFNGTLNILNSIKKKDYVKSVIITTTDKVYKREKSDHQFREVDDLGGIDPYSASKVCAEIVSNSYIRSIYKNNLYNKISIARAGNVLGGGDYADYRLVPDIIKILRSKKKLIVRNPDHIRPWQHVIEPLYGYLLLAELQYKNKIRLENRAWNFGPEKKNFQNVKMIVKKFRKKIFFSYSLRKTKKFAETKILKLNSNKAKKNLKWVSKWNIDEIIEKIFEWHNEKINSNNLIKISEKQIKEYLNK